MKSFLISFFVFLCSMFLSIFNIEAQVNNVVSKVAKKTLKSSVKQSSEKVLVKSLSEKGYGVGKDRMVDAYLIQTTKKTFRQGLAKTLEKEGFDSFKKLCMNSVKKSMSKVNLTSTKPYKKSSLVKDSKISTLNRQGKSQVSVLSARSLYSKNVVKHIDEKLTLKQQKSLYEAMSVNKSLESKVCSDPDKYITLWSKCNVKTNEKLIDPVVLKNGVQKKYAMTYSGKVYSFDPDFNPYLKAQLKEGNGYVSLLGRDGKKLSERDLQLLNEKYPNGFAVSKTGFPDFKSVALKDSQGKVVSIDLKELSSAKTGSNIDINNAKKVYLKRYGVAFDDEKYVFHHIENTNELVAVPKDIHGLYRHAGGRATFENVVE